MLVGEYLQQVRIGQNLSVQQLANEIGVDPSYLSRVERGSRRASRRLLSRAADKLRLSEPEILALGGYESDIAAGSKSTEMALVKANGHDSRPNMPVGMSTLDARTANARLRDPLSDLLPSQLLPSNELNEVYELRLAKLEADLLTRQELIDHGAYFLAVDGQPTNHFRICTGGALELPKEAGARLQSFLGTHRFKSSYATHGLFPYRGKFHPQMIKAIINVMGLKRGDVVLDPMAGSGTTTVEASLMGIDSVGIDVSPFCVFMARAKLSALKEDVSQLEGMLKHDREIERVFKELSDDRGRQKVCDRKYKPRKYPRNCLDILALAFMDARGFAERSSRKSHSGFFVEVLTKYIRTIRRFQNAWGGIDLDLGDGRVALGDARALALDDESIDGVVFSPPYSFAIDYVENGLPHLDYLGVEVKELKRELIGLRGRGQKERALQYFDDMEAVLKEVGRVLRPSRYCTIIVGSNSNQLSRALKLDPDSDEARYGIESRLIGLGERHGLYLELAIRRLIVGMANTMREEHILFLRNGAI